MKKVTAKSNTRTNVVSMHSSADQVRDQETEGSRLAHEYRVLSNERGGSGLEGMSTFAIAASVMGVDNDGDPVDSLLEEIALRLETLSLAVHADGGTYQPTLESELCMLERRAQVARELLRRSRGDSELFRPARGER